MLALASVPYHQDARNSSPAPHERRPAAQPASPGAPVVVELAAPVLVLHQNDPNPFCGETSITYRIDEASRVRLRVYDLCGRHVATLVDAPQEAGGHTITFDGEALLAGGTYLYRLETTAGVETRRMTLVR